MSDIGTSAHGLAHGLQRRVVTAYPGVLKSLDWATLTCTVTPKHRPGLPSRGRLVLPSGSAGTLYPPIKVGDVVLCLVSGPNLTELLRRRFEEPSGIAPQRLFDRTDVFVLPGCFTATDEPAGRLSPSPPAADEWLIHHASGAQVRITAAGDIILNPASDRNVFIGGMSNAKSVLVDGDANSAGGVAASQSILKVGTQ